MSPATSLIVGSLSTLVLFFAWLRVCDRLPVKVAGRVAKAFMFLFFVPPVLTLAVHEKPWASLVMPGAAAVAAVMLSATLLVYGLAPAGRRSGRTPKNAPASVLLYRREYNPVYVSAPMAVYETSPGRYSVMRNGSCWGKPFETTDADLAVVVCDRWADEFARDVRKSL